MKKLIFILFIAFKAGATYGESISINSVDIKMPLNCNLLKYPRQGYYCKENLGEFYIGFKYIDDIEDVMRKHDREKEIFKINDDTLYRMTINDIQYGFMYLNACKIAIHSDDVRLIFKFRDLIKNTNNKCGT
ncbi:MAG: hypothetical protein RSD57_06730 [Comamonas sp.]